MDTITKDLVIADELKAVTVFTTTGIRPIIDKIKEQVKGIVPDTTTTKGRDNIVALAFKVTRSKTLIDSTGKKLVDGLKEKCKPVDAARKIAREELTDLANEVRKPVTEWEETEAKRIEEERVADEKRKSAIADRIDNIRNKALDCVGKPLGLIRSTIKAVEGVNEHLNTFDEFEEEAGLAINYTIQKLKDMADAVELQEKEKVRLAEEQKKREAEQKKIDKERAKLDKEKAELEVEKEELLSVTDTQSPGKVEHKEPAKQSPSTEQAIKHQEQSIKGLYQNGFYYLLSPQETTPTLVMHYYSNDSKCSGFGFNVHDGGGFLPEDDLTEETKVTPVNIVEA